MLENCASMVSILAAFSTILSIIELAVISPLVRAEEAESKGKRKRNRRTRVALTFLTKRMLNSSCDNSLGLTHYTQKAVNGAVFYERMGLGSMAGCAYCAFFVVRDKYL